MAAMLVLGAPTDHAQTAPAAPAPGASAAPSAEEMKTLNTALRALLSQADPAAKDILDRYPNYAPLRASAGGGGRGVAANVMLPPAPVVGEAGAILLEDFESTPVGQIPAGFTATGKVAVANDFAHSGTKSLKMEAAKTARGASR